MSKYLIMVRVGDDWDLASTQTIAASTPLLPEMHRRQQMAARQPWSPALSQPSLHGSVANSQISQQSPQSTTASLICLLQRSARKNRTSYLAKFEN